jgi:hypothetical protein
VNAELARPKGPAGRAIEAVSAAARVTGARAFLVGGPVRDMLLGIDELRDVDIAIEGNAEAVIEELVSAHTATVRRIGAFMTFKARFPDGTEIDVATTRRERYEHPGALPVVEPAPIGDDLLRRDFSINAMALDLHAWSLVDPAGGASDVEKRLLRVLHEGSFSDDPTRILRGLRFEARFGLEWESRTRVLLRDAIDRALLTAVATERIWREVVNAAGDAPRPSASLLAIARSRALETIVGAPPCPTEAAALERADAATAWIAARGADPTAVRIALFLTGGTPNEDTLKGIPLKRRLRDLALSTARDPRRNASALAGGSDDRATFGALSAMSCEELAIAALIEPSLGPRIERFELSREQGRRAATANRGTHPGPWVGAAARATAEALFVHAITPGEAAAFASSAALDYLRTQDRKE